MAKVWKTGRGKIGFLKPVLGEWVATADSPMGPLRCTRALRPILNGTWLALDVRWEFGDDGKSYQEHAVIGPDAAGMVRFWSFTSDGKRSEGVVADVTDLHPEAVGFEAQMPAGLARMAYWPLDDGFVWVAEAKTKKGWSTMARHEYHPV